MKKLLGFLVALCLTLSMCAFAAAEGAAVEEAAPEEITLGMTALKAEDPAQNTRLIPQFATDTYVYTMYVQSDVYGVRLTPEFVGVDRAVVTMSGDGIDPSTKIVASGESFVLDLTQLISMYRKSVSSTAVITVGDLSYTVTVMREDGSYLYDAFKLNTWQLDGEEMYYWLYVPEDYNPAKAYPVVMYLHGGGQTSQIPEMILMRTQQAASFLRYGYGDCIIIAPQANNTTRNGETTGWYGEGLTPYGQGAYDILQMVKNNYRVDAERVYITGASMGGAGTMGMLSVHPEAFAAALVCCGAAKEETPAALLNSPVALWIGWGEADPVAKISRYEDTVALLDGAGIPFISTIYDADTFLYPNAHFSWMPTYANPEILAWMFNQSKSGVDGELIDIKFEESTQLEKLYFDPEITEYTFTVQSDIYGVRITPFGKGTFKVNGTEVKGGEAFELALSEEMEDYRKQLEYEVVIETADKDYTIKIIREDGSPYYDAFDLNTYALENGKEMYYWLSVPENYNPSKQYPVVLALHGGGQTKQAPEMILYRCMQASALVKHGYEAIIIAPQNNYTDLSGAQTLESGLTDCMEGAYQILQKIKGEYSVDANRVYITGLSAGGVNAEKMLTVYPDEFAAGLLVAVGSELSYAEYDKIAQSNIPVKMIVNINDSDHISGGTPRIVAKMRDLGIDAQAVIYPTSMYLSTTPHFSWIAAYADTQLLDWMFAQVNG